MRLDSITSKLIAIVLMTGVFLVASLLVLVPVSEREERLLEVQQEIAAKWGNEEIIIGPMLVTSAKTPVTILPEKLQYEATINPEVRSRGIFKSIVYTTNVKISGTFSTSAVTPAMLGGSQTVLFSVPISDTRGIEQQLDLKWDDASYTFNPGPGIDFPDSSGVHTRVPITLAGREIPFSFEVELKGSKTLSFAPLGRATSIKVSSPWPTPKFIGALLPTERELRPAGFTAEWQISSFARSYPQIWSTAETWQWQLIDSATGVELYNQMDFYTNIFRSVKYAVLFLVVTFLTFFVFEILAKIRIHTIQYSFIGAALALFYLLLLSFAEYLGFNWAYSLATLLITGLITLYSRRVLKNKQRGWVIFIILVVLYSYLYFVLRLEDYALLFGSLLIFVLLATIMYLTRNVNWFELSSRNKEEAN